MLADRRTSGFDTGRSRSRSRGHSRGDSTSTSTSSSHGRRLAEYKIIRTILELDNDQDVCTECATISESEDRWQDPGLCQDCADSIQLRLRLNVNAGGGMDRSDP